MTALQQTAAPQSPTTGGDTVVVHSPLPGGVAAVTRFLLTTVPQWVQLGGLALAAVVAVAVVWYLVRHRAAIRAWFATRTRGVLIALGAGAAILLVAMAGFGTATWNYTQHSNEFCTSCHVMNTAFGKFSASGNKHNKLSCHDCHTQSVFASVRQLYFWLQERPDRIGKHAKVPNQVCEGCHVTKDTATWQRVRSTAGHRVHLESDSSALKDVMCVTCHGVEVHHFEPAKATCGQSGCHKESETRIVLDKMRDQTIRHCTICHGFTEVVPALATRDSARGTLAPGGAQCFGCHDMKKALPDFDPAKDPHGGKCGTCHNPHTQETPAVAAKSCTTQACHGNWRNVPFHVGAAHRKVASIADRCLTCHTPHAAKVDASDCAGCHANVRSHGNLKPPAPFDTTKALRRVTTGPEASPEFVQAFVAFVAETRTTGPSAGDAVALAPNESGSRLEVDAGTRATVALPPPAKADTFSHTRHAKLACLVCHQTTSTKSHLTFVPPRGCDICHHQAPASSKCTTCHDEKEMGTARQVSVTVAVPGHSAVPRPVDFLHSRHASRKCVDCHTTPVTLAASSAIAQCKDCHTDHHAAGRTCSACHTLADPKVAHATLDVAHTRCDACHTASTVAELTPTRTFCSTCHAGKAANHYAQKECSTCHFLAEPGAYRAKLTKSST